MSQDLTQLRLKIEKAKDRIAEMITPSLVRSYFPNDLARFGMDPLSKTFEPEEIQAIDGAVLAGNPDTGMNVLRRDDRLLFAENISQVLLARYKNGGEISDQEVLLYSRVNSLGSLRDDKKQLGRARKEI